MKPNGYHAKTLFSIFKISKFTQTPMNYFSDYVPNSKTLFWTRIMYCKFKICSWSKIHNWRLTPISHWPFSRIEEIWVCCLVFVGQLVECCDVIDNLMLNVWFNEVDFGSCQYAVIIGFLKQHFKFLNDFSFSTVRRLWHPIGLID